MLNNTGKRRVKVSKYLPRVWQNSQKFVVPSLAQFKVKFDNPNELYQVFLITGLGVIRQKNPVPSNYQFKYLAEPKIWNLNLPLFLPKTGWEINAFQQNFLTLLPNMTIRSGSKSLTFLEIVPKKKLAKGRRGRSSASAEEKKPAQEETVVKDSGSKDKKTGSSEPVPVDTRNATAPLDPQEEAANSTSNLTQTNGTATSKTKGVKKKGKNATMADENEGAAVFRYVDTATGVSQKFAFSLRYYIGQKAINEPLKKENSTGLAQIDRRLESGVYSFAANGTSKLTQKSYRYGELNLKRSKRKVNNDSSEFLLVYEQRYGRQKNETQSEAKPKKTIAAEDKFKEEEYEEKIRAHVRINLNDLDNFIKFDVSTNEVPIDQDKTGKDVVVDWFLMDGFDTNETFWVDANGLQMVQKSLNTRKEYKYNDTY